MSYSRVKEKENGKINDKRMPFKKNNKNKMAWVLACPDAQVVC